MWTGYFYNINQSEGSRAWKNGTYFKNQTNICQNTTKFYLFISYIWKDNDLVSILLTTCRSQWLRGLRPFACWDRGFESHWGYGCLSVVSVVCCQVEVSATSWSLVQRSLTECGALCVWWRNLENEEAKARYRAVENTTKMGCNAKKTTTNKKLLTT